MKDYKEKYEIGSNVTAKRTFNGEIITGEFGGFHLLDKSNPKSIVGVVHTPNGSYDVEPNSIESAISEDEKIRKELIHFLEDVLDLGKDANFNKYCKSDCAGWIAWLEKQGKIKRSNYPYAQLEAEQKPTDKVEPIKIEKDKWYICIRDLDDNYGTRAFRKGHTYHSTKDETLMPDNSNIPFEIKYCVNDYFRLWTIKDAKDGDILEFADHGRIVIGIVSHVNKVTGKVDVKCLLEGNNFKLGNYYALDTIKPHPATKEQCNLLFSNMKESGYEWDVEKKELKKIEEKPIDKVEPKFKVGDWIINSEGMLRHILDVDKTGYQTDNGWLTHDIYDNTYHLWTIKDAKDGDVLSYTDTFNTTWVFLYKYLRHIKPLCDFHTISYHGLVKSGDFYSKGTMLIDVEYITPSTTDQRDILFQKMKEAGYEWDADKKELRKIEQKHAWSKEDEEMISLAIDIIGYCKRNCEEINNSPNDMVKVISWLESLTERVKPRSDYWSEEDEKMFTICASSVRTRYTDGLLTNDEYTQASLWLKSLKDRMK